MSFSGSNFSLKKEREGVDEYYESFSNLKLINVWLILKIFYLQLFHSVRTYNTELTWQ